MTLCLGALATTSSMETMVSTDCTVKTAMTPSTETANLRRTGGEPGGRTIWMVGRATTTLVEAQGPISFWAEAAMTGCMAVNMMTCSLAVLAMTTWKETQVRIPTDSVEAMVRIACKNLESVCLI
ncbi:hypothetical protein D3C71_1799820 [compost metagenome]